MKKIILALSVLVTSFTLVSCSSCCGTPCPTPCAAPCAAPCPCPCPHDYKGECK